MGSLYTTTTTTTHRSLLFHKKRTCNKTCKIKQNIIYSKTSTFQEDVHLNSKKRFLQVFGKLYRVVNSNKGFKATGYANPSRLLPATKPEVCTDSSLKNILTPLEVEGAECSYKVKLYTSGLYGSGLSDLKAGILVCLVDEKGDSILQRIPAILDNSPLDKTERDSNSDITYFQRGSTDEFIFRGPKLQKIVAVWIGLESGQWRPGGISLIVTYFNQPTLSGNDGNKVQYICTEYAFEIDDILLGEEGDSSMAELRPSQVKDFVGDDIISLSENLLQPTSMTNDGITKEESMREYADLKFSLLLYDVLLVLSCSSIASFSAGRNSGVAFFVGGTIGFFYLLLLQRSVDRLPAPGSISVKKSGVVSELSRKFEGPVSTLILAFILIVIAVKYGSNNGAMVLTPKEVMCGMLGFLVCKVAVVLAAFKALPIGTEENK